VAGKARRAAHDNQTITKNTSGQHSVRSSQTTLFSSRKKNATATISSEGMNGGHGTVGAGTQGIQW
jgi:hypothetical protein